MTCPKQGSEMEAVVLCRVGFLAYSYPKQGQDFKRSAAPLYPNMGQVPPPPGSLTFCLQKRKGQHKFDATKRWVTRNFTASGGRVTILNKKYKRRAMRFYIHAHRDSSGPTPLLLKNECSLTSVLGAQSVGWMYFHHFYWF